MSEFKTCHPIVNLIYFVFVIGFACVLMHPVALVISLSSAIAYSVMLKSKMKFSYLLPIMIIAVVMNLLFNHEGTTVMGYLPNGNPLTLEAAVYGVAAAVMLAAVIYHFSCYNEIMTSDKFIYLFGRIIPTLSLVLSMTLRFVPRFSEQFKVVANAQKGIGKDISEGNVIQRAKNGIVILSAMMTWAFENAIETADSMKARGYGLSGRTTFSVFRFDRRDAVFLALISVLGVYVLLGSIMDGVDFIYYPTLRAQEISLFGVSIFAAYFLLCACPMIIEIIYALKFREYK